MGTVWNLKIMGMKVGGGVCSCGKTKGYCKVYVTSINKDDMLFFGERREGNSFVWDIILGG